LAGQLALAVLFAFAAWTKLRDRRRWRNGVGEFLGHDGALVLPVAVAVPAAEILVAAALLTPGHRYAAAAALALLAGFSLGVSANLARGRSVSCNCFGSIVSKKLMPGSHDSLPTIYLALICFAADVSISR